jgi:hydroxymethylbilane synthase
MLLRVGTRGSRLSLVQTDMVVEKIKRANRAVEVEKSIISTSGDLDRSTPLFSLDQKGIFEKEVDQAVLDGRVDFAVHSMKDVPTLEDTRLIIAAVPERGPVADVLVSHRGVGMRDLQDGGIVGTSSLLRAAQVRRVRPELRVEPIIGNVDTRIQKVERGDYDAAILAEAGLARLGLLDKMAERLSLDDFMPAPGQGALAIVTRRDNPRLMETLRTIEDRSTRVEVEAERELVKTLEGGCKVPIGALASANRDTVHLTACILSADGLERLTVSRTGPSDKPEKIGRTVGEDLLAQGAKKIEETWRAVIA